MYALTLTWVISSSFNVQRSTNYAFICIVLTVGGFFCQLCHFFPSLNFAAISCRLHSLYERAILPWIYISCVRFFSIPNHALCIFLPAAFRDIYPRLLVVFFLRHNASSAFRCVATCPDNPGELSTNGSLFIYTTPQRRTTSGCRFAAVEGYVL